MGQVKRSGQISELTFAPSLPVFTTTPNEWSDRMPYDIGGCMHREAFNGPQNNTIGELRPLPGGSPYREMHGTYPRRALETAPCHAVLGLASPPSSLLSCPLRPHSRSLVAPSLSLMRSAALGPDNPSTFLYG